MTRHRSSTTVNRFRRATDPVRGVSVCRVIALALAAIALTACSEPAPSETATIRAPAASAEVVAVSEAAAEPASAAPAVTIAPPSDVTGAPSDRPAWWLDAPTTTESGFAATVEAEGASVLEARAAAVDEALTLAAAHAADTEAHIEKTLITNPAPGRYKAFILVTAARRATAQADTP